MGATQLDIENRIKKARSACGIFRLFGEMRNLSTGLTRRLFTSQDKGKKRLLTKNYFFQGDLKISLIFRNIDSLGDRARKRFLGKKQFLR